MDDEDEIRPSRPKPRSAPVIDNRTHRAFAYQRTARGKGKLSRQAGIGYIGSEKSPEQIAALFDGAPVDAEIVRKIFGFATAHLFMELNPWTGGTGYFVMLPKDKKRPRNVLEPDDPREDDDEDDETEN